MCGINGYLQFNNRFNGEQISGLIKTMNDAIIHRGPDQDGLFICDNIGLGMRRLSIIDLSTGTQPIYNEDRSLVIVFNGEIYNYREVKKALVACGHSFTTQSDTEVALHAFEEYGYESFTRLKGMFAYAIYNLQTRKLLVIRDRTGEKPLYYYLDSEKLLFASELKSLSRTGLFEKKLNNTALCQYLQLTYIPAPLTIFQNVFKLLPGHYMEIDNQGKAHVEAYWDVKYDNSSLIEDYDTCKQSLRQTLFNAVEECMLSDVPLGAFLSGGIDSSIIVGVMSQISPRPIDTFTIAYHDKEFDESDRAQLTATMHKTNHHVHYLDFSDAIQEVDNIINHMDEPFADSSAIPSYIVAKFAKQQVKVVLTGDAGDELFGGYSKYLIGYYAAKYNKIPEWLREEVVKKLVYAFPDHNSLTRQVRKVIANADKDVFEQRRELMCLGFKKAELEKLLDTNKVVGGSLDFIRSYYAQYQGATDELAQALYTDFKVVLEGCMFPKVDRMSMLNSLETRAPLMHNDVIELAARVPGKYKIRGRKTKLILKETFSDLLPPKLLNASKRGFRVPIGVWFRNELKQDLLGVLNRKLIEEQGIFNYNYIREIMEEHFTRKKDRSSELWSLYVFQKWYQNNMI